MNFIILVSKSKILLTQLKVALNTTFEVNKGLYKQSDSLSIGNCNYQFSGKFICLFRVKIIESVNF